MYQSIKPGKVWLDTNGKRIQAHGLSVFVKDGLYYWYGENKEFTRPFGTVWHWGVRCYVSKDLYNWEDKGLIIPPDPNDLSSPLHPTYSMDRPHIIFCEKTGKYIAWLKIMAGGTDGTCQFMSVMQANSFMGPYEFVHKMYKPFKMDTGDFALHVDEVSKKAYFIFERPHFEMITATLTEDYTGVENEYSTHFQDLLPPWTREAPAFFERNGKKYLFTSGTSGYFPNPSRVAMFDLFHGEYVDLGDPHVKDKSKSSFNSQISCVLKIPGKDLYIACADRWQPGKKNEALTKQVLKGMERRFKDYKPDRSPKEILPLPMKKIRRFENTRKSDYVWLPIEWAGDKPIIQWRDEWRLEEFS